MSTDAGSLQSGKAVASWAEYDCYPDQTAVFKGFRWAQLVSVN